MSHFFYCSNPSSDSILKAMDAYPSASYIVEVCEGYMCFDTESEYLTWLNQK